jgi:hypothetical protein
MALTVGAQAFFELGVSRRFPTSREELMPANALSSATWSAMLALGASIGGLVTFAAGRNAAFVVNSLSFFASAYFISRTRYRSTPPPAPPLVGFVALIGIRDLLEGLRYVRQRSHVAALMFVKAGWGLAGRVLLLLTISGSASFKSAAARRRHRRALGARGVGAALGRLHQGGILERWR